MDFAVGSDRTTVIGILIVFLVIISLFTISACILKKLIRRKFIRRTLSENRNRGEPLTREQAITLYKLQNYRNKVRNNMWTERDRCGRALDSGRVKAVHSMDFFYVHRWSRRLQDALDGDKNLKSVVQKTINEMNEHTRIYDLKPETRRLLIDAANLSDGIVIPKLLSRRPSAYLSDDSDSELTSSRTLGTNSRTRLAS
ncbi:hypothetical protein M3Y96_01069800 [Aphelenchoides besseyi]|nr:hypothetical protein M3Y96_01069800 [Aphelenchoides besseyi]